MLAACFQLLVFRSVCIRFVIQLMIRVFHVPTPRRGRLLTLSAGRLWLCYGRVSLAKCSAEAHAFNNKPDPAQEQIRKLQKRALLADEAAEAAAAVWAAMAAAANRSINALCSAMRSSSGAGRGAAAADAAEASRGLARAICQKCVWANKGLRSICLCKGKCWSPGVDMRGKVGGNPV